MSSKFFINAYLAPPPKLEINNYDERLMEKGYKALSEARFTHAIAYYEQYGRDNSEVLRAINIAAKYNISYIVSDIYFGKKNQDYKAFEKNLKELSHYPYGGHFLFDEPGRKELKLLSQMLKFYSFNNPDKLPYYNIQPLYSPPNYLEYGMWANETQDNTTYDIYLNEFMREIKPDYLSYDFYPFYVDEPIKDGYFAQLKMISQLAKEQNIGFYPYIQSCSWQSDVRIPTFAEVVWQCGMSMCYGAKGLQYFCFFTPYSNGEKKHNVAMLDFNCNPTERYDASKVFNGLLSKIEDIYFKLEHIDIFNGTNSEVLKSVKGSCKIGMFENDENFGLFITNSSFENAEEITLEFDNDYKCKIYGFYQDKVIIDKFINISLSAGESIFLSALRRKT